VLSSDDSSNEEEAKGESRSEAFGESISVSAWEFLQYALLAGYSIDEIYQMEALSTNVELPNFGSVSFGAGHIEHHRTLAQ